MTSNYSTIEVDAEEIEYKNETSLSIFLGFLLQYITLTNTYITGHIQMRSNYKIIEVEAVEIGYKIEMSYSIYLRFLLHYITHTS